MNGEWLLLTQAAPTTMATNSSLALVKSRHGAINALTHPLQNLLAYYKQLGDTT